MNEPNDLSRLDIDDIEVAKDAAHELERCQTSEDFARWAQKWGRSFVQRRLDEGDA